jgi:hypothetical protein
MVYLATTLPLKKRLLIKPIETIIDVVKPVELSLFEKAYLYTNGWFKWILALIFLYLLYRFLKSFTDLR